MKESHFMMFLNYDSTTEVCTLLLSFVIFWLNSIEMRLVMKTSRLVWIQDCLSSIYVTRGSKPATCRFFWLFYSFLFYTASASRYFFQNQNILFLPEVAPD